jgi:hypothetical protein
MNLKKKLNEMQKRPPHFISGILKQKRAPFCGALLKKIIRKV